MNVQETLARQIRRKLGFDAEENIDVEQLLIRAVHVGIIESYSYVAKNLMFGAIARYNAETGDIAIDESWRDKINSPKGKFTIAHEMGHVANGHVGANSRLANPKLARSAKVQKMETEANQFAAELLAPSFDDFDLATTAKDLQHKYGISAKAAEIRLAELQQRHRQTHGFRRDASVNKIRNPRTFNPLSSLSQCDLCGGQVASSESSHQCQACGKDFGDDFSNIFKIWK